MGEGAGAGAVGEGRQREGAGQLGREERGLLPTSFSMSGRPFASRAVADILWGELWCSGLLVEMRLTPR